MFALLIDNTLDTEDPETNMRLVQQQQLMPWAPTLLQPPLTDGSHSPAFSGASFKDKTEILVF